MTQLFIPRRDWGMNTQIKPFDSVGSGGGKLVWTQNYFVFYLTPIEIRTKNQDPAHFSSVQPLLVIVLQGRVQRVCFHGVCTQFMFDFQNCLCNWSFVRRWKTKLKLKRLTKKNQLSLILFDHPPSPLHHPPQNSQTIHPLSWTSTVFYSCLHKYHWCYFYKSYFNNMRASMKSCHSIITLLLVNNNFIYYLFLLPIIPLS